MKFVYLKYIKNEMLNIKPMLTISFFFDFVSLKQFRILAIKKLKIIENIINIKCFMSFMEQKIYYMLQAIILIIKTPLIQKKVKC